MRKAILCWFLLKPSSTIFYLRAVNFFLECNKYVNLLSYYDIVYLLIIALELLASYSIFCPNV